MSPRRLIALPVVAVLLAAPGPAIGAEQTVSVKAFAFTPSRVEVKVGEKVTWRFDGPDTNHSVTAEAGQPEAFDSDPGRNPSSADHLVGTTYERRFDVAGTFRYFCKVHPSMRGTVVVGTGAAPSPPPGTGSTDTVAPVISAFTATRRAGRAVLRLTLSEDARVVVRLRRGLTTRTVKRVLDAGASTVRLSRTLPAGRYAVSATATDNAGNASKTRKLTLTVPKKRATSRAAADDAPIASTANGNAFTGGLSFAPADISGRVGQTIRWTNTDVIAPHTVTEANGLFDLVGNNVNGTPVSPSGFGPGTAVDLPLVAGTIAYFCRVHPVDMKGILAVPVTLALSPPLAAPKTTARTRRGRDRRAARRRAFQRTLFVTWAASAPAAGQVFDVELRRGSGPWTPLVSGTTQTSARAKAGVRGTRTAIRSRLRLADDVARATGWSPEAIVTG